jgi:hypothetical protein
MSPTASRRLEEPEGRGQVAFFVAGAQGAAGEGVTPCQERPGAGAGADGGEAGVGAGRGPGKNEAVVCDCGRHTFLTPVTPGSSQSSGRSRHGASSTSNGNGMGRGRRTHSWGRFPIVPPLGLAILGPLEKAHSHSSRGAHHKRSATCGAVAVRRCQSDGSAALPGQGQGQGQGAGGDPAAPGVQRGRSLGDRDQPLELGQALVEDIENICGGVMATSEPRPEDEARQVRHMGRQVLWRSSENSVLTDVRCVCVCVHLDDQQPEPVPLDRIIVDSSGDLLALEPPVICDACQFCEDTCEVADCSGCQGKRQDLAWQAERRGPRTGFTMCEIRRHRTLGSCWIVAKGQVSGVLVDLAGPGGGGV